MRLTRFAMAGSLALALTLTAGVGAGAAPPRHPGGSVFTPGNLLVSRSVFTTVPDLKAGVTQLPPGCTGSNCVTAVAGGQYPYVFNNALVDGSFGVTSKIFLDQVTPGGRLVGSIEVPNDAERGAGHGGDQMVTSFSSKSELSLNLSTDGRDVTFMGYDAPVDALDASNANTPGVQDPANPVPTPYYRAVAEMDAHGHFHFTLTNAYTGDNGRAAILNAANDVLYAAGNASGNLKNPNVAPGVILGAGAQILEPQVLPERVQRPGTPTPVGSFSITELPGITKQDKVGKDTNFRGITIFHNVLYYTKGSGGKGVNSVYFVDTAGTGCTADGGVGLPSAHAQLPTAAIRYNASLLTSEGVTPYNMCILKGFQQVLNKDTTTRLRPFGLWFANPTTLYVADEGNGDNTYAGGTYTAAAAQTTAGLQKWVLSGGSWHLAYTLQAGLDLGRPYTVPGYPAGINAATGLPWSPATDGLRDITGRVNRDGTATIYAVTSTVSGSGDQGADPDKLVAITDRLDATTPPPAERFTTLRTAGFGEVLRGVSFAPRACGTGDHGCNPGS